MCKKAKSVAKMRFKTYLFRALILSFLIVVFPGCVVGGLGAAVVLAGSVKYHLECVLRFCPLKICACLEAPVVTSVLVPVFSLESYQPSLAPCV